MLSAAGGTVMGSTQRACSDDGHASRRRGFPAPSEKPENAEHDAPDSESTGLGHGLRHERCDLCSNFALAIMLEDDSELFRCNRHQPPLVIELIGHDLSLGLGRNRRRVHHECRCCHQHCGPAKFTAGHKEGWPCSALSRLHSARSTLEHHSLRSLTCNRPKRATRNLPLVVAA